MIEERAGADLEVLTLHADLDFFEADAVPLENGAPDALIGAAVTPDDGLAATKVAGLAADEEATTEAAELVTTAAAELAAVPTAAIDVAAASRVWEAEMAPE